MSIYRTLLAAAAAIVIASPVFADDSAASTTNNDNQAMTQNESGTTATDSKVNLNTATVKELMKVKGLNAAKARAIVAYRKKNGNFKSIEDLSNVKGFKKLNSDTLKSIEDQLSIE